MKKPRCICTYIKMMQFLVVCYAPCINTHNTQSKCKRWRIVGWRETRMPCWQMKNLCTCRFVWKCYVLSHCFPGTIRETTRIGITISMLFVLWNFFLHFLYNMAWYGLSLNMIMDVHPDSCCAFFSIAAKVIYQLLIFSWQVSFRSASNVQPRCDCSRLVAVTTLAAAIVNSWKVRIYAAGSSCLLTTHCTAPQLIQTLLFLSEMNTFYMWTAKR